MKVRKTHNGHESNQIQNEHENQKKIYKTGMKVRKKNKCKKKNRK